jgi:hypothetical protein
MILKTLKDKKVNQFGWIHGDKIFNMDIPLLLPREAQFKDFEMEGIENYTLVEVEVTIKKKKI